MVGVIPRDGEWRLGCMNNCKDAPEAARVGGRGSVYVCLPDLVSLVTSQVFGNLRFQVSEIPGF